MVPPLPKRNYGHTCNDATNIACRYSARLLSAIARNTAALKHIDERRGAIIVAEQDSGFN